MKVLIELVFIAILAISVWSGYKKGLVMTVGSILIIIISLFVGDLLSDTFSHEAVTALRPFVAGYMEGNEGAVPSALAEISGGVTETLSTDDFIELRPELEVELCRQSYINMGIYSSAAKKMAEQAVTYHQQANGSISASIVEIMCENFAYYLGFILFFAISVILLTVLGNISNLSFKIPNADKLNTLGGAVSGFVVGFLFCSFAAWILRFTGMLLPEDEVGILFSKLFVSMDMFSSFLSI